MTSKMMTMTTTTLELHLAGEIVTISSTDKPETVVAVLNTIPGVDASYTQWTCSIGVWCKTAETIEEVSSLQRKLRALHLLGEKGREVSVSVYAAPSLPCPVCGWNITREALDRHINSPECRAAQDIAAMHDEGFIAVPGPASKALSRADIPSRWLLSGMTMGVTHKGQPPKVGGVDYMRLMPAWAVQLAKCTIVPIDLRVATIEHCYENSKARDALMSALRLGAARITAFAPQANSDKTEGQKKKQKTEKQRMRELFEQALVTVG